MLTSCERMMIKRYLLPMRGEAFVFLIASISLLAVALGVAALICVMCVMIGFRAELFDRILGVNGHAVVQGYGGRVPDWRNLIKDIEKIPEVIQVQPLVELPLMASFGGRVEGVLLRGMRMADILHNPVFADNIKAGDWHDLEKPGKNVAIGTRLAQSLGVDVGDRISLLSPQGRETALGTVPRIVSYQIVALFEVGVFDYDKLFVLSSLSQAQKFSRLGDAVGVLEINTKNPDEVSRILAPLIPKLANSAVLTTWKQMNSELFEALLVEETVMFWVISIIILVAVFNILSSLIMLVRAKTRDIAVLRTMGASQAMILRIFMSVGTVIGVFGTLLGSVLGFAVLHFRASIVSGIAHITGANLWDPSIRYLTELPARVDTMGIVMILFMTVFLSFLATLYPAWYASRTDPVKVLRYE